MTKNSLFSCVFFFFCFTTSAGTLPLSQSQAQLQDLNIKIGNLKQKLEKSQHQQSEAEQQLAETDKEIDQVVRENHLISLDILKKQTEIQKDRAQIQILTSQLRSHQNELMKQVQIVFMLGKQDAVKTLLKNRDSAALDRTLMLHQYLMRARLQEMTHISHTRQTLLTVEYHLKQALMMGLKLNDQLKHKQLLLSQAKEKQTALFERLAQRIKTDRQMLHDFEKNKRNLTLLFDKLIKQPSFIKQESHPNPVEKPLSSPIQGQYSTVQPMHQGLVFFSQEGVPVHAVQAGQVMFSDWFKGYGLMLILDHGHGWMSLYAYNQALYKHRGEWVKAGEQIATVGHSGGQRENALYFEVRHDGHVIKAADWLMANKTRFAKLLIRNQT